jgi:uncharacterized protein (DUF608 family)
MVGLFDKNENGVVDVSHGLGIPFGGIGTGYSVFGRYGFVKLFFNSIPDPATLQYNGKGPKESFNYLDEPENKAPFALLLNSGNKTLALQESPVAWRSEAQPVKKVSSYAYLPKGYFEFETHESLKISMTAFSPTKPHDLKNSTIPIQVYEVCVENLSCQLQKVKLELAHREKLMIVGNKAVFEETAGQMAFAFEGGQADASGVSVNLELGAGESKVARLFISWFYPAFNTPSPAATDSYIRYYTKFFSNAAEVIDLGIRSAGEWSAAIDAWHESIDVPAYFKRLWFSSLTSVITSTMLSIDPYFFEIETPHRWVCTMDVNVYSSWLYMINWPEIERMEMDQYLKVIPTEGEKKGFVWHSLWSDACHYVEEPIFLIRVYRDFLWFNDRHWLGSAFTHAVNAANCVYQTGNYEYLIKSVHGNQSYDAWKMPGVSSFVNSAWVYGLYSLNRMSKILNRSAKVDGIDVSELADKAAKSFDKVLWNAERNYWNCFYRTPDAEKKSTPESAFTDQLFGKWAVSIDPESETVLPSDKVKRTLGMLYEHNLIDDKDNGFRGWVNGLLPGHKAEMTEDAYHARVFWICAQLDLGSLLGMAGDEKAALDVFKSLEASLKNNHLAVGEWNQAIDENLKSRTLPEEAPKDTPRFPPYPRYKCSWEYLIRMLGLRMDETSLYLSPFKTIDFSLQDFTLAGMTLTVKVETGWSRVYVNGVEINGDVRLSRSERTTKVEFRK